MSQLRRRDECISDLTFDRWLGESVEPTERDGLLAHLESCVRCSVRHHALANQRAGFLERVPSWAQLAEQQTGVARARGTPGRWLWGSAAVLAAGVVLGFAIGPSGVQPAGLRSKGGPHIGAFVKRGEQVTRADDGARVQPGDYVRFTYSSDRPVHFALLNRDDLRASTYYPLGEQTVEVAPGRDVALDFSIKLDAQPGDERVHGLFCDQPQRLEPLRAALQATGKLPPLPHCRVDVLRLEKRE